MHKLIKAASWVIALSVLALPVKSEEKVWYCETVQNTTVFPDGISTRKQVRFKLRATSTQAQFRFGQNEFAQNGFVQEKPMTMRSYRDQGEWMAGSLGYLAEFNEPYVSVVLQLPTQIIAVIAKCEDF